MSTYTKKNQLNLDFDISSDSLNSAKKNHIKISNVISFSELKSSVKRKKDARLFDRIISLSNHLY